MDKMTDFKFVIFCCYLPPENSVWGRNPTQFFSHLITQLYMYQDHDFVCICGDFNARIGNMNDIVNDIDDVCKRKTLDNIKGGHGETFIEFVKDCKVAILNGRISPEKDNYTCISFNHKTVVDCF